MAFAKLSGALLARKDARGAATIAELVSVPVAAPPPMTLPPPAAAVVPVAPSAAHEEAGKLLTQRLKALNLQAFLAEYDRLARECEGLDHSQYLLRLAELELNERQRRTVERRIKGARFPAAKNLDGFDFSAIPSLDQQLVLDLARGEYVRRQENVVIVGNSGTGKTHIAIALGLAACQQGLSVGFVTAHSLAHQLLDIHDEWRLLRLQQRLAAYKVLIIDELGYAPLSTAGAGLMFEIVSQRYERGSTIITSNLPCEEWAKAFGTVELAGAVLERLTYHVHLLEMNGESYRRRESRQHAQQPRSASAARSGRRN
jgi:DNA replication protein DnaC